VYYRAGGHLNLSYVFYYRVAGSGERFRKAYQDSSNFEARIFRLASETIYDIVGSTLIAEDMDTFGLGVLSTENSTVALYDSMSSLPSDVSFFDFGVCIFLICLLHCTLLTDWLCFPQDFLFELDASQQSDSGVLHYDSSTILNDGSQVAAAMALNSDDEYDLFTRGQVSSVSTFTTDAPTKPGEPPAPTLSYATGGALHLRLYSPNDTGTINRRIGIWDRQIGGKSHITFVYATQAASTSPISSST
jgi:hypothetical protein